MSNGYRWAPSQWHALNLARLPRLALLTLAACLVSLAWANHASAVVFSSKPFADNRPGTTVRDVVVRGSDNHVWLNTFNGTNWNGWLDLGGDVRGRPTSVSFGANHLDVFARDSANHLMHRWWNGTSFSSWEAIGGGWQFVGDPIPVSWSNGRIDVFARGTDNALIHTATSGGGWISWESLGGSLSYDPAVISHHAGHLDVFAVTPGGFLNHRYFDSAAGGWSGWQGLGGYQFTSAPSAAATPGEIMVVARGTDGAAGGNFWNPTSGWIGNFTLGGNTTGQPAVVSYGDPIYGVFLRGTDNYLYHRWTNAAQWSNWVNVGGPWVMTTDPYAIAWGGSKEDVFAIGNDGSLIHTGFNGSAWQTWENLGAPYPSSNQYGGADHIVNTSQEKDAVQLAMQNAESDSVFNAIWNGLSPADQTSVSDYAYTQAISDPAWPVADWSIQDITGTAASTKPAPSGLNTLLAGSCWGAGALGTRPLGAPTPTRATRTWITQAGSKTAANGKTAYKILADVVVYPWFRNRLPVQVSMWARTDSSVDGAPIANSGNSTTRDATRAKKMPWYYHLAVWTYAGRPFYWSGLATWNPVVWEQGDDLTYWYGDKIPGQAGSEWYRCST
jgi:hypothetical protein